MRLAPLLLPFALSACTMSVAQINPTPNVLLASSTQTLALAIGADVHDSLTNENTAPASAPTGSLNVTEWRATLTNGFRNGIARFFAPAQGASDLTLVIVQANPWLEAVRGGLYRAHVRFQAELVDREKHIVKTWADTTVSREFDNGYSDSALLVRSAVEAMYEEIANGMPVPAPPAS